MHWIGTIVPRIRHSRVLKRRVIANGVCRLIQKQDSVTSGRMRSTFHGRDLLHSTTGFRSTSLQPRLPSKADGNFEAQLLTDASLSVSATSESHRFSFLLRRLATASVSPRWRLASIEKQAQAYCILHHDVFVLIRSATLLDLVRQSRIAGPQYYNGFTGWIRGTKPWGWSRENL
ncbi:hypothetical protein K461DRAFT_128861 [Myriangium duriaei CBS 260.36]|uniref:Uncharacterized protein n=1 Tax=Myriangium duriaei CBS 260.36 TaxID=1168546 RepID=A0A9P4J3G2_9PEZI|nr:hypothetical protein K461DRAFT_128861 [Myriangium duriaei CBS 260.36]